VNTASPLVNTATLSQTVPNSSGGTTDSESSSFGVNPTAVADVSILKTVSNTTPADGSDVTYTLHLTNAGPDAAAGVSVSDPLPAGLSCVSDATATGTISGCGPTITWTVGSLANGASATATITVQVNAASGTITNTATETQSTADPSGTQVSSVSIKPHAKRGGTPVPPAHTGEPWSSPWYWLLVAATGLGGTLLVELGRRRRRTLLLRTKSSAA